MDSLVTPVEVLCDAAGITLIVTLRHSVNGNGPVAGNELWHPDILLEVALQQPEIFFQSTWAVRLTNGDMVYYMDDVKPYPDQAYPITLTKTVRAGAP